MSRLSSAPLRRLLLPLAVNDLKGSARQDAAAYHFGIDIPVGPENRGERLRLSCLNTRQKIGVERGPEHSTSGGNLPAADQIPNLQLLESGCDRAE